MFFDLFNDFLEKWKIRKRKKERGKKGNKRCDLSRKEERKQEKTCCAIRYESFHFQIWHDKSEKKLFSNNFFTLESLKYYIPYIYIPDERLTTLFSRQERYSRIVANF